NSVCLGTPFSPTAGPDIAVADDGIGVHHIYADLVGAQLCGVQPAQVQLCCLGGSVSCIIGPANQGVFTDDVNDVPAYSLFLQYPYCRLRNQKLAFYQYVIKEIPIFLRMILNGLGNRQSCVINHDIDAAEGQGSCI